MPNSSVFIFLMLGALYRTIHKKHNFSFSTFLPFLCLFGVNDTLHFTYCVISLASETSAASMTSTASTISVASMTFTAHFIKRFTELDVSIGPDTKMTYPGCLMWDGS
jgi:hypothetical protein